MSGSSLYYQHGLGDKKMGRRSLDGVLCRISFSAVKNGLIIGVKSYQKQA
jgi:hypothetical protein